ncbi:MAG: zinc-binding alcohol dehydrogenase family protein [Planctomycetales bacterium]|nr:zinc-binding alcohol dehydrogenase family protein [Planctomycetales bacterium]
MKAIQLTAPQQFAEIDIEEPQSPGPGEALVRVHRVGICGTDISGYLGKMPFFIYPRIPGHELGVEVLEVGSGVANVAAGDRCSVEPYMNCGDCHACRKGASNCCANLKVLGVMTDGGLRDRFVLPAHKLHPSRSLAYEQLALVETLAIGCHAVNRGAPVAGENCLVTGAGPIGLATIEFVKLSGARTIVLDMNQQRLDFCRDVMQVDQTILLTDRVVDDLRDATDGNLPDVVIDATGHNGSMSNAFGFVAPTGRLVFVGITTQEVTFKHPVFHRPEGTLLCSRNALPGDFTRIIRLIEEGQIKTDPWITHRTPIARLIENFPAYTRPETGVIKSVVEVSA